MKSKFIFIITKIKRLYIRKTSKIRRKKISNSSFTIISNNCWAGFVYQSYGLKYNTPTIGMFFVADDYIKFISNLDYYLSINEFESVEPTKSKWYNQLKNINKYGKYPIARLGDIELHLLHYNSIEDAQLKWNQRKKRINRNKILYKFSEMNLCNEKNIIEFQRKKLKNKICFISKKYKNLVDDNTYVVSNKDRIQINAIDEPIGASKIVDINKVINSL